ncbi:hypothetical protein, conserved [Babesia bigemina]|uniref:Uncharacterized protein n=1 Tax=Babesia bigemina TaxID=5866 RepID=A0A061BQ02_BABBI|nr:hypothetical protein, conserved [Babesia bigemina]CDR71562.1 hypothetical protein, conserved [Babesia bigemina]|eukprot:XP_012770508.1 hypothetical protein, conserved [Babesia bigemina]
MQSAKQIRGQTCPQMADQIGNQNANQTCDRHPSCGLKSPLQSFLEDGLQGFLPHSFTKPGCKLECAVPNHFGKPCLTPMGFSDISITASHSSKGKRIKDLLERFCGRPDAPLASLCSSLTCVLQRAPQTLGDMFGFFQGYLSSWSGGGIKHKQDAFNEAVRKAYFDVQYDNLIVTSIQQSSNHKNGKHLTGDLFSLIECKSDSDSPAHPCGAYLQAICDDTRVKYSKEHADRYLSWVVYITETFYDLLKKLYDECSSKCGDDKPKCRTGKCPEGCDTQRLPMSEIAKHNASCSSILKCPSTHPTLYKYGFTFGSPFSLSGEKSETTKRTCHDFCKVLKIVVKENNALHKLAHEIIPQFLWDIRSKFFWTTVALWSLSLFYLLHIMVIRLDLLHIKSHLNSPSSHRIAAQSLLAAARCFTCNHNRTHVFTVYTHLASPTHLTYELLSNVLNHSLIVVCDCVVVNLCGDQCVDQCADQSVDQRGDQCHDQRGDQCHDQRADQGADQSADQGADQGADQRVDQSGDQRADQGADQSGDQSGDQRVDQVDGHGSDDMVTAAMTVVTKLMLRQR